METQKLNKTNMTHPSLIENIEKEWQNQNFDYSHPLVKLHISDFWLSKISHLTHAIEEARQKDDWQPIVSAPTDGTHILGRSANGDCVVIHFFTDGKPYISWNRNGDDADYRMDSIIEWRHLKSSALDTILATLKEANKQ